MSAVTKAARAPRFAGRRMRKVLPAKATGRLPLDKDRLPIPHVNIIVRDTHVSRISDHYYNTVRDDLMYMTYVHDPRPPKPPRVIRPLYDKQMILQDM